MARGLVLVLLVSASLALGDDWPQWLGPERDSVWRETGIVRSFPDGGPKVRWRTPINGGYAGPAVASGRVYVTDYLTDGDKSPDPSRRNELEGTERVLCLNEADGKVLWEHKYPCSYRISYPAGPRATPTIDEGRCYTLGAMGNLICFECESGDIVWQRDLKKDYGVEAPLWGFCGHPLIDENRLYCVVGGEGSVAVCLDKGTGKELWRALSASEPGYSPPTSIEAGGKKQLLIWNADALNSLDPVTGGVYWSVALKPDYGMSIMPPRQLGDLLFASGIGDKGVLLRLAKDKPGATEVWRNTPRTALSSINSPPFLEDGHLYGVDRFGQLRCISLEDGKRLWETVQPTTGSRPANSATAFLVKNGDVFFIFSETGDLIIARLSPAGYEELSRAHLLDKTYEAFGRDVIWSHPAFANRSVYARNDKEIVCAALASP